MQAHPEASLVEFTAPTNVKDSRIISALAGLYQQAGVQGAADGRAGRFRGGNEEREKKRSWNDLFVGIPSAERRLWVQRCGLLARFPDGMHPTIWEIFDNIVGQYGFAIGQLE